MKGSTKFWLAILISLIIYGIYSLIINWNTFPHDIKNGIIVFGIVLFFLWEVILTGGVRNTEETTYKPGEIHWYSISLIWGVYVLIKYYLNPLLDKLLED